MYENLHNIRMLSTCFLAKADGTKFLRRKKRAAKIASFSSLASFCKIEGREVSALVICGN